MAVPAPGRTRGSSGGGVRWKKKEESVRSSPEGRVCKEADSRTHAHARARTNKRANKRTKKRTTARGRLGARAASSAAPLRLAVRVGHLRVLRELQRGHRVAGRLERHGLATAPARVLGGGGASAACSGQCVSGGKGAVGVRAALTPGIASGPKWPWPGVSAMNVLVNGSYLRCGPRKQVLLFVDPCSQGDRDGTRLGGGPRVGAKGARESQGWRACEMKSWFSAAFMSSP